MRSCSTKESSALTPAVTSGHLRVRSSISKRKTPPDSTADPLSCLHRQDRRCSSSSPPHTKPCYCQESPELQQVSILMSALGTRQRFPRCGTSRTPSTISGGDDPAANRCEDKLGPPTTTLQGPSVHSLSKTTRLKPRGDAMTKRHLPRTAVPAHELSLISANALSREEMPRIT